MLVFGGYDGLGSSGYKGDIHLLINIEQSDEEVELIYQWRQEAQLKMAALENNNPSKFAEYLKEKTKADLTGCVHGAGPCKPSFSPEHPMPWDADDSLRTWTVQTGPL